jgi:TonB-linked SusC/RagA family outer membrane protein
MKLTAVLLIAACLQVSAKGNAQNISISQRNTTLEKVFKEIHRQTGYQFFYQDELLQQAKKFDISVKNASIEQVLELCFKDQPLNFTITEKTITIKRKEEVNVSNAPPLPPVPIDVTGKVKDENGKPLAGVSVSIVGGKGGVSTDGGGNFSISVPENAVLSFSYVGYKTVTIPVKGKTSIEITLNPNVSSMTDVVVIGYGSARKTQLVGSTSIVNAKDAGNTIATNPAQLLIGKAAGVQVLNTIGTPGSNSQIIIRGTGSFTSVDPLYVIDGIQANGNIFNSLSSQDIENITILKDASSTAIYGAAAANGVVIITTKKLRSGTPRVSVTSQVGTSQAWRQLDLLKAKDYVDLIKDYAATKGVQLPAKFNTDSVNRDVTDWQKEIFRNALSSETDVNVNGGSEKVLYNFSLGYITQKATMKDFQYKKINTRFALDETLGRFHFGQSLNIRYSSSKGQIMNLFFDGVTTNAPYQPIYDPTVPGGYSIVSNARDLASARNPLQTLAMNSSKQSEYLLNPQLFGEVNIIKGLSLRSQISATYGGGSSSSFRKAYTSSNDIQQSRQALMGLNNYFTYTFENYLSYNRMFGKHNISAIAGTSYIDEGYSNELSEQGNDIANDNIQNVNVALVKTVFTSNVGYGTQAGRTKSYFGRVIYSFNDRYVLSGSIRRDGSSNFGPRNRYGNFPGAGFAWNFTEEDFIKRSLPFISNGKLRVGWGRTGNNRFDLGKTDVLTYSGNQGAGSLIYSFGADEHFVPGTTVVTTSNPDLRWEETEQTDAGIDLGFLKNRVTLTVDWYNRKSRGLLVNVPLPSSAGLLGVNTLGNASILTNAADAENKGIEVSLGYRSNPKGNFNYNISANISYNKNTTLALGKLSQVPIKDGNINSLGTITITQQGSPIGSFYGKRVDHVARDTAEIVALNAAASAKTGVPGTLYQDGLLPGDFIFKDLNGDGVSDSKDKEILGNPIPKYIYGFNMGASYKQFDFNLVLSGIAGLKLANGTKYYTESVVEAHNTTTAILNRWRKPGDVAALPRAGQSAKNLDPSDFYMENGSYTRLRNITLGYTFSQQSLKSFSHNVISSLRIYVAAQNLFTITDYKGYDPEVGTQDNGGGNAFIFRRGIDTGQLPQPRTFLAGVQFQF